MFKTVFCTKISGAFQLMSVAEVNLKISSKAWSIKFVKQQKL